MFMIHYLQLLIQEELQSKCATDRDAHLIASQQGFANLNKIFFATSNPCCRASVLSSYVSVKGMMPNSFMSSIEEHDKAFSFEVI